MMPANVSSDPIFQARFWERIDRSTPGGCWPWNRGKFPQGYGAISVDGKLRYAHRVSYELINGPIPDGLFVCHKCDNPPCVNPEHLYLGDVKRNSGDAAKRGRYRVAENAPNARYTNADILKIRELYATGRYSYMDLCKLFGIPSRARVSEIVLGKNWKSLLPATIESPLLPAGMGGRVRGA